MDGKERAGHLPPETEIAEILIQVPLKTKGEALDFAMEFEKSKTHVFALLAEIVHKAGLEENKEIGFVTNIHCHIASVTSDNKILGLI